MTDRARTLAQALDLSGPLLTRYLAGFDDDNRTTQAPGLPNHAAWTLGHCAVAMHRLANRLTGSETFPERHFAPTDDPDHPGQDTGRFAVASVVFGSTPIDRPALYPRLAPATDAFDAARARLVEIVLTLSDHDLDTSLPWHSSSMTAADLIARITFHNGTHAGQLTDLRRALALGPITL